MGDGNKGQIKGEEGGRGWHQQKRKSGFSKANNVNRVKLVMCISHVQDMCHFIILTPD